MSHFRDCFPGPWCGSLVKYQKGHKTDHKDPSHFYWSILNRRSKTENHFVVLSPQVEFTSIARRLISAALLMSESLHTRPLTALLICRVCEGREGCLDTPEHPRPSCRVSHVNTLAGASLLPSASLRFPRISLVFKLTYSLSPAAVIGSIGFPSVLWLAVMGKERLTCSIIGTQSYEIIFIRVYPSSFSNSSTSYATCIVSELHRVRKRRSDCLFWITNVPINIR